MADLVIQQEGASAYIKAPFNRDFIRKIKLITHSQWNSERNQWMIPNNQDTLGAVRRVMRETYGIDDRDDVNLVDVTVTFKKRYDPEKRLVMFDKVLASVFEQLGQVRVSENALVIGGDLVAGGSAKYPRVIAKPGTVLKVYQVREDLVDSFDGRHMGQAQVRVIGRDAEEPIDDGLKKPTVQRDFNLVVDPWIKAFNGTTKQTELISLKQLFANPQNYRRLAGETKTQDLAILRLLLAILTTTYSRVDADGKPYPWLKLDDQMRVEQDLRTNDDKSWQTDLEHTWEALALKKSFGEAPIDYLDAWQAKFDFSTHEHGFYQVTEDEYNKFVVPAKQLTEDRIEKRVGSVPLKQIDRRVSESNNSPAIFTAKKTNFAKNKIELPELIRWVIAYQNFAGITDKTKIQLREKRSGSPGWLYKLNPVVIEGHNLFETLLLNLVLVPQVGDVLQHPVWEFDSVADYVNATIEKDTIDNIAELYTNWARLLHIKWVAPDEPVIYSAIMPIMETTNAKIEPMTTWRTVKNGDKIPNLHRIDFLKVQMTRELSRYVPIAGHEEDWLPGSVEWLRRLMQNGRLKWLSRDGNFLIWLNNIALISDGKPTSQVPSGDRENGLHVTLNVLTGQGEWPTRLADVLALNSDTQKLYWKFAFGLNEHRQNDSSNPFISNEVGKYANSVDHLLNGWLQYLAFNDWERCLSLWHQFLADNARKKANDLMQRLGTVDYLPVDGANSDGKSYVINANTLLARFDYDLTTLLGIEAPNVELSKPMAKFHKFALDVFRNLYEQFGQDQATLNNIMQAQDLNSVAVENVRELIKVRRLINHATVECFEKLDQKRVDLALFYAMQCYAQHQRVTTKFVNAPGANLFAKLRLMRSDQNQRNDLDRLVCFMEAHREINFTRKQLKRLVAQLASTAPTQKIDYAQLAVDFYCLLSNQQNANQIYQQWGAAYFKRFVPKSEKEG